MLSFRNYFFVFISYFFLNNIGSFLIYAETSKVYDVMPIISVITQHCAEIYLLHHIQIKWNYWREIRNFIFSFLLLET